LFTHHAPHEPGEGESGVLAVVHAGVVEVADVNLHGSVILGLDEAVGPAALARDVEVDVLTLSVDHLRRLSEVVTAWSRVSKRATNRERCRYTREIFSRASGAREFVDSAQRA